MLSLRRRLVLMHLLAILVIVGTTAGIGWWILSQAVQRQLDGALLAIAEAEVSMLAESEGGTVRVHEAPAGSAPPSLTRLDRLVQIVDADGLILARSSNLGSQTLPVSSELKRKLSAGETSFDTLPDISEEPIRMVSVPTIVHSKRYAVQVAGSLDDANFILRSASALFVGLAIALLIVVGWAGVRLSSKLFDAIQGIVDQAREIEGSNLHQRLPHTGASDDEIGHLISTLNAMLERIERGFETQRRFTADASHELRSPLSRLRAEIEITLRRSRDSAEYVATLRSCLEEVEHLTTLVDELLMLARLDAGQATGAYEQTSLAVLAQETIDRMRPIARDRKVEIAWINELDDLVEVNRGPLGLVLRNVLDNAIKFSPEGGLITVRALTKDHETQLVVTDEGPGVDETEMTQIFDRFFRGKRTGAAQSDGFGLGLALSRTIMLAHGGQITVANVAKGGALFTIHLR